MHLNLEKYSKKRIRMKGIMLIDKIGSGFNFTPDIYNNKLLLILKINRKG